MSFFTDLENALSNEVKVLEADIVKVAQYFKPMVIASAQEIGQVALQAVLQQAPAVISGTEKFSNAVSSVVTTLGTVGKQVAISDAQTAVQAAYNLVSSKATKPAA